MVYFKAEVLNLNIKRFKRGKVILVNLLMRFGRMQILIMQLNLKLTF